MKTLLIALAAPVAAVLGYVALGMLFMTILGGIGLCGETRGYSMKPTLSDGMDFWMLPCRHPRRWDVVCAFVREEEMAEMIQQEIEGDPNVLAFKKWRSRRMMARRGVPMMKRIIALPGETVQIKNGRVYINGELLTDDPLRHIRIRRMGKAAKPLTLGPDEYFLLGDNRNDALDSREFGPIPKKDIFRRIYVPKAKDSRFRMLYRSMNKYRVDTPARAVIIDRVNAMREKEKQAKKAERRAKWSRKAGKTDKTRSGE